jgi:hypothetical protein
MGTKKKIDLEYYRHRDINLYRGIKILLRVAERQKRQKQKRGNR